MIHVENLTKNFGPVCAVNDVTFEVERNEIVGLLGNNGAGKTTLMRMLTTYLPASSGVAKVAGYDVMMESMEVRKRIGYLPESVPLYPEMRVSEYLEYRAKLKGVDRRQRQARIDFCLASCRIREVQRRLLGTLSKGYRQRVGLADAMINDPPILILDEPTDGLDPGQKQETLALLRELGKSHTIMLSSHLLSEVEALVDRVIIMRRGLVGLSKRIADLESDPIVIVEAKGHFETVKGVLESADGVERVSGRPLDGEFGLFEVRCAGFKDLREQLATRLFKNGHPVRRLDLRRRTLLDRWNDINAAVEHAPATVSPIGPPAAREAVTPASAEIKGN